MQNHVKEMEQKEKQMEEEIGATLIDYHAEKRQ